MCHEFHFKHVELIQSRRSKSTYFSSWAGFGHGSGDGGGGGDGGNDDGEE